VKFTEAGGAVTVDVAVRDGVLQLSVCDTGIGIPADKLETLGQPFVQVQNDYTRHYEGTGLGLSLVKGLVALHGGHFAIASVPGEGTIITISIAADGSGAGAAQAARDRTVEFPPRLKTVAAREEGFFDGRAQAKIA
jgi:cell cycle sensor histidine kinase DivJ